jgi:hypothetical protein
MANFIKMVGQWVPRHLFKHSGYISKGVFEGVLDEHLNLYLIKQTAFPIVSGPHLVC